MFKKIDPKMNFPKMEEEVLKFWDENDVFQKSIDQRSADKPYVFYDGPPFATGTPHYGHIVASTMKDVVPRYWTMKGYRVERKWGWDCHGLPIENIVEKELGSKAKKDIEKLGVEKFNALCRSKVLGYVEEWKKVISRLGRWADMENAYKTMDLTFMESVWWVFKQLWDKGLVYESYRSMHICPRCETTLSQSEVAEGYKDVKDLSVIAKFELLPDEPSPVPSTGHPLPKGEEEKTYILAWTTTPWTLIGNVALAVGNDLIYTKAKVIKDGQQIGTYITSSEYTQKILPKIFEKDGENISYSGEKISGSDLVGKSYKPLFDYYAKDEKIKNRENGWKIYAGDFVTTEEGTGVVHIAPAFGEDDMNLGKQYSLPFIQHVGMDGIIKDQAGEFAGMHVKPLDDTQKTDVEIIKYLAKNNLLFAKEKYEHSYPHCWRCETPLLNYATTSWFVSVEKIKDRMIELAGDINWSPDHIKKGRWGNWLEGARDWSISRQRFWASVMPIWKCDCSELKVIGAVKELEDLSGQKITDIHKDVVDKINFPCVKCGGTMKRIPDVLDTWFDSGSMPYAERHYPFENKEKFEASFPAQFIAEGIDQTRAWFYYLHVIAAGIKDSRAFSNVVVNGIVLAEDGQKMAKRLKNYPDPMYILEKYGADSLRYYLISSPVMQATDLNFKEADVSELVRGMFRMLWNSYSFFVLYANIDDFRVTQNVERVTKEKNNLLDRWIVSELQMLIKEVDANMENYELTRAARLFPRFIDNLSNWYIRRSRKRFWKSENDDDKNQAYETLHYVLVTLAKLMAPFAPFIAEEIYRNLTSLQPSPCKGEGERKPSPLQGEGARRADEVISVHLNDFPVADEELIDEKLNVEMNYAREIVNQGLAIRAERGIKVRQPLSEILVSSVNNSAKLDEQMELIILEELNLKNISWVEFERFKDILVIDLGDELDSKRESRRYKLLKDEENDFPKVFQRQLLVALNTEITPELKLEGVAREIIRHIQSMRKEAGYEIDNRIKIGYSGWSEVFSGEELKKLISRETLADEIKGGGLEEADLEKKLTIEEEKVSISIKRC